MARRFTLNPQDNQEDYGYDPSRFSRRSRNALQFEQNDERFKPKSPIGFVPDEQEEEDPDPYGYDDIISRYRKELGGEQPALARYRQALQDTPQQQDYDLGKWGKVGAALAGFGAGYNDPMEGIKVATTLRQAPWQRALAQHDKSLEGLGTEAEFEQDDRKNRMAGLKLELDSVKDRRTADETSRVNSSLISRREAQNRNDAKRLGLDYDRYVMDYNNIQDDNERDDVIAESLDNYRRGQLRIGDRNAATGERNATTSAGNLGLNLDKFTYQQERDNVGDYHWGAKFAQDDRKIDNENNASWLAPNVQRDAQDYVTQDMLQDPQYRSFFEDKANSGYWTRKQMTAAEQLTPEYLNFEREYARRVDAAENRRRNGTGRGSNFTRQQ